VSVMVSVAVTVAIVSSVLIATAVYRQNSLPYL